MNNQTRFKLGGFLDVAGGVALDAFGAFHDLESNGRGQLDRQGLFIDEQDVDLAAGGEIIFGFAEDSGAQLDLFIRVRIDEGKSFAVRVAELECLLFRRQHFDGVGRGEALVERLTIAQIAHLDLDEGAQVARRTMLRLHDEVGFTVELDDLASADVVGCGHG